MLPREKRMQVLEAYDLTKSFRAAGQLTGVDHHTVARAVAARTLGHDVAEEQVVHSKVAEAFADKIVEWIERSNGRVRADVVHDKLRAMDYSGSERTTRRVVAALKTDYHRRNHRIYKPWITEPGGWLQYDFGVGPLVDGVVAVLFCAWLAWSRFRVIIPLADRSLPSLVSALDRTFRALHGAPTYVLTDNERTVTDGHVAGLAVRNPEALAVSRYYGITLATCVPYDPESKGGSEATVRIAKADLVPTAYNLRDDYGSFAELEAACAEVATAANTRPHALTRRVPTELLATEQDHLHLIPDAPYTAAFGESRAVGWSATVSFRGARYSVPHTLAGGQVWVRASAEEVVIVAGEGSAATEVARHPRLRAGQASICDEHYPPRRRDPLRREPRPTNPSEAAFLALGEGAKLYLVEAAATGVRRIEARMAEAVALATLHGRAAVDDVLGVAAVAGRFGDGDPGVDHRARLRFGPLGRGSSSRALPGHGNLGVVGARRRRRGGPPVILPGPDDDALELLELLSLLEDLCAAQPSVVSAALSNVMGPGYGAAHLGADAARLGALVARAVGIAEVTRSATASPCPHPHLFTDMDCGGGFPGAPT